MLDLTGVVSGPFATMFLADQGAEVLKIEPIGGGRLSIDVKSAPGREVLSRLVAQADVLVQNFRPGTMERLGLGVLELRQRHPRLIYISISGVGDTVRQEARL